MKMLFTAVAAVAALLFSPSLFAQYNWSSPKGVCQAVEFYLTGNEDPMVAIDPVLIGKNTPKSCNINNYDPTGQGLEEMGSFGLHGYIPLKKDTWTTATFSFRIRSRRAGRIRFSVSPSGNYQHPVPGTSKMREYPDAVFCGFARIHSPQFSFPNGGFFASTNLKAWGYDPEAIKNKSKDKKPVDSNKLPKVKSDDKTIPKEIPGGKYVRACNGLWQYLDVKPGKEYTITVVVKPMEYYEAQY